MYSYRWCEEPIYEMMIIILISNFVLLLDAFLIFSILTDLGGQNGEGKLAQTLLTGEWESCNCVGPLGAELLFLLGDGAPLQFNVATV